MLLRARRYGPRQYPGRGRQPIVQTVRQGFPRNDGWRGSWSGGYGRFVRHGIRGRGAHHALEQQGMRRRIRIVLLDAFFDTGDAYLKDVAAQGSRGHAGRKNGRKARRRSNVNVIAAFEADGARDCVVKCV